MIDRNIAQAQRIGVDLADAGYDILAPVVLNQVLARAGSDDVTLRIGRAIQASGVSWFGFTRWEGRPAFRISVSSWRTGRHQVDELVQALSFLIRDTA